MTGQNWVRTWEQRGALGSIDYMESLGGVAWHEGQATRVLHRCRPQTRGWLGLNYVERCRCGAIRDTADGPWADRNSTRRGREKKRREAKMPREQVTCRECRKPYEAIAGSAVALERLCTTCWAKRLVRTGQR